VGLKCVVIAVFLLSLTACGGEEETKATTTQPSMDGAWNSYTSYAVVDSELQSLVDEGGEIKLPCGRFEGGVINIPSGTTLIGSGACTVIPSIRAAYGSYSRLYSVRVSNLRIDGEIDGHQNIGADFRNCSYCVIENVSMRNVDYGVLFYGDSWYNKAVNLNIIANETCFEIVGVANENTIRDGLCQNLNDYGIGVRVENSNNTMIDNVAFENIGIAVDLRDGALFTAVLFPRCEKTEICIKLSSNSKKTTIISPYISSVGVRLETDTNSYKDLGF